ncbi:hypothetical protein RJ639_014704 [Escallonia herrerae]|uniref:Uncharacterized protein n=1 Tax=Escallonia herrerae TaxID=1293975 RepID=A0AA88VHP3_9ASTE|nr:hypothetical protein RJ639_014704 [Escallonia herrerae]
MKKSFRMLQPQSLGNNSDGNDQFHNQSMVVPAKFIATVDSFEKKDNSWFAISHIPADLSIQVQDITFYVHKHPLASRCGYLGRIELQPRNPNVGYDLKLENFPGGSETFEVILKFCYGLPVGLKPSTVAALRCASEFLEMNEELEEGNLMSKTEAFLTFVVLSSWRDSITVLKSCENLAPWAENLQIVRRCSDVIAWKASRNSSNGERNNEESWWFNDVASLRIDHFMRIITAVRAKGLKPEILGSCIVHYADKWLPGIDVEMEGVERYRYGKDELQWSISSGRREEGGSEQNKEQRMIIECLVSILPHDREAVSCKFLLWMLKIAIIYSVSPALTAELEKRVGMVLENANATDLLIPNHNTGDQGKPKKSNKEQTTYNIDVVLRILEYFFMHEQQQQQQQRSEKLKISRLLDNYLAEVARDPSLTITKFQVLAQSLPEDARTCNDGLYRSIDIYLKTHPSLSEHDRRRLCNVMDWEKLSFDACMHAAQNDRLPLRTVIQDIFANRSPLQSIKINTHLKKRTRDSQVLFSEQVKMREAMQGKEQSANGDNSDQQCSWPSTKSEIKTLKVELEKVKTTTAELQRDYAELQKEYEKLNNQQRNSSGWTFGWRKIKQSALFHGKLEVGEIGEGKVRSNPIGCKVNFLRRKSIS